MSDLSKVKKEYIQASEVPRPRVFGSQWDALFSEIPKGQALVLHEPEVTYGRVRAALYVRQRDGKFKNLHVYARGERGKATLYVVNTDKPMGRPRASQESGTQTSQ